MFKSINSLSDSSGLSGPLSTSYPFNSLSTSGLSGTLDLAVGIATVVVGMVDRRLLGNESFAYLSSPHLNGLQG